MRAVLLAGASPVLVDVDADTWNAKPEDIIQKITSKTKAILLVHTYGLPVNAEVLLSICKQQNIILIEDVAEAIGLRINDRLCGSFGHISTYSFYCNKHVTTGEGGMILTNDDGLAEKFRTLRNLGFESQRRFEHRIMAPNYRLTNMQAAIGLAQLELLDETIDLKRKMGLAYLQNLADFDSIQLPLKETSCAQNVFWVFGIIMRDQINLNADRVIEMMKAERVGCREFFWPMHEQPVFKSESFFGSPDMFPVSSRIARKGLYLPSGVSLTRKQISTICSLLRDILRRLIK